MEREQRPDHLDHVEQAGADGARRDQRDEGDRQRDHEGEQRAGADLPRGAADRGAEGREGRAARRRSPPGSARKRPQSMSTNSDRPASISSVTTSESATPEADLLDQQGRSPDQPASQAREGVLLPLERQRAGDQEHRHEHQRHGRGDRDRERVEARRRARDDLLLDVDRVGDRARAAGLRGRGSGAPAARTGSPGRARRRTGCCAGSCGAHAPRGSARSSSRPRMLKRLAEQVEAAAPEQQGQVVGRDARDLLRDPQVRLGDQRADPVVHEARLDGVLLVDQDAHGRLRGVERRRATRACGSGRAAGSAPRARRPTRPCRRACCLAGHRDAVDPRAELAASAGDVELGAAEDERLCPAGPR